MYVETPFVCTLCVNHVVEKVVSSIGGWSAGQVLVLKYFFFSL